MDQDQWRIILSHVRRIAAALPKPSKRFEFSDTLIVGMYLWAVSHDRPMVWACDKRHYNQTFRPRQLPSVSQFHRRVRTRRVHLILQRLHDVLGGTLCPTALLCVDGKPLPVGHATKDPDARVGYAGGKRLGRGYKLHVVTTEDRRILTWSLRPMNEHEMPIAAELLAQLPSGSITDRTLVLADGNYDAHELHKKVAHLGGQLITRLRGQAKHPVTLRQMGAARRELLQVAQEQPSLLRMIQRQRNEVELTLSNLTSYGGGLGPLPSFVRTLPRATRWVGAKIILYHARRLARKQAKQKAG